MTTSGFNDEEYRRESSWRYPLGVFLATLILCAVFLYYYVGPSMNELGGNVPSPAISEEPVDLKIGGLSFSIPAHYTVYPRDRRGGARDEVYLYALWPNLSGYAPARRDEFVEDAPDTRRIDITLAERTSTFKEADRIEKLYLPQTIDSRGVRTPEQLVRYAFREQPANVPTNGYADADLLIGEDENGAMIGIFCVKDREEVRSPSCWRQFEYGNELTIIYRFKRPYLPEWRAIDSKVRAFVEGLRRG